VIAKEFLDAEKDEAFRQSCRMAAARRPVLHLPQDTNKPRGDACRMFGIAAENADNRLQERGIAPAPAAFCRRSGSCHKSATVGSLSRHTSR
jgi:hypothetical protein